MKMLSPLKKNERGQALVEMALVLPLLIIILFSLVELGRLGHASLTLQYAAREGARTAITGAGDDFIRARIISAAPALDDSALVITLSPPQEERVSGGEFRVLLDYEMDVYFPLLPAVVPDSFSLQGKAVMRIE
jgi:Flp pilus assembly protein TadG